MKFLNQRNRDIRKDRDPVFGLSDEGARSRTFIIASNMLNTACSAITSGVLYTGFLLVYGISLVNVGIISLVPTLTSVFILASPGIMARFRGRKLPVIVCRLLYYLFTVLGITLIPALITDPGLRVSAFVAVLFVGHTFNALSSPASCSWHIRLIPDRFRVKYFSVSQFASNLSSIGVALVCSIIADAVTGGPDEQTVMVLMRYVGFVFALLDVGSLFFIREIDWTEESAHGSGAIFAALRDRKFLLTMLVVVGYALPVGLYSSLWNVYLLDTAKVSYTYISVINMVYLLVLALFSPFWRRILSSRGWFPVFCFGLAANAVTNLFYAFTTAGNYLFVMTAVRLTQHLVSVGFNITLSNLSYVNLPERYATGGVSCYLIINNGASLLGQALGTLYVGLAKNLSFTLFGITVGPVQQLMLASAFLHLGVTALVWRNLAALSPEKDLCKLPARFLTKKG